MAIRRAPTIVGVMVLAAATSLATPGTAEAAGTWHTAVEVPGVTLLDTGHHSSLGQISCSSAGNCSAGGSYTDSSGNQQAFVVDQVNGSWHLARELPGTAALNKTLAGVDPVSCFATGNCSAGGSFSDVSFRGFAFVVDRINGTWHNARQVPGTAALSPSGSSFVASLSCRTGGNCSAAGSYDDAQSLHQVFVANRVNGTWAPANEIPGTANLNAGGDASVESVSCGSAGNCSLGGQYLDGSGHRQVFVANRVTGTWHNAVELPGTAALNAGGEAILDALSCGAPANCGTVGSYLDGSGVEHAFVANRISGVWHPAVQAPGIELLSGGHFANLIGVSCPTAGNCSAGGQYDDAAGHAHGFVISEVSGSWGNAVQVPGLATLDVGNLGQVKAVSCASAGNCTAGGTYKDGAGHIQAFLVEQTGGVWGTAFEVPGVGSLNAGGNAAVTSVSCRSTTGCTAGGTYVDAAFHLQPFVVDKT
jgi:hypothetical protein